MKQNIAYDTEKDLQSSTVLSSGEIKVDNPSIKGYTALQAANF